jgi:hypothetical protein
MCHDSHQVWILAFFVAVEFAAFAERIGGAAVDVGVLVCGPSGLQTSVARECRSQNLHRGGGKSSAVFHFNSHSFDF